VFSVVEHHIFLGASAARRRVFSVAVALEVIELVLWANIR
jgi:hypothetical protein